MVKKIPADETNHGDLNNIASSHVLYGSVLSSVYNCTRKDSPECARTLTFTFTFTFMAFSRGFMWSNLQKSFKICKYIQILVH